MSKTRYIKTIIIILVFLFPVSAFSNWVGSGTSSDPYLIFDIDDLQAVADLMANGNVLNDNLHFKLMANIPGPVTFGIIGRLNHRWNHNFDGNNKKITMLRPGSLFGITDINSVIKDLNIDGQIDGNHNFGAFTSDNRGLILNCTNYASINGGSYAGGIAGVNNGFIIGSANHGRINASNFYVGGITGMNYHTVSFCINTGDITSLNSGFSHSVGGIVGSVGNKSGDPDVVVTISHNVNIGTVHGDGLVGGIIGMHHLLL